MFINSLPGVTFAPTGRVVARGGPGTNATAVSPRVTLPAWPFAGPGRDALVGGGGPVTLIGGLGRNVTIGGRGAATLEGGPGQDLMIGGSTAYDANEAALAAILAEWTRGVPLAQRVGDLSQGVMANGSVVKLDSTTVVGAPVADELFGGGDTDWFLVNTKLAKVYGRKKGSVVTPA